jgi:argininosuccinate lyase
MKKLWDKGYSLAQEIEHFTVGDDAQLDQELIIYDCLGSIAHAYMLSTIGILQKDEYEKIHACLQEIIDKSRAKTFVLTTADEDVHTAVENYMCQRLGDIGKKIHAARSRNDQVMLDLRLFMREQLFQIMNDALELAESLLACARKYHKVPIPGRTHFQRAMPSSVGLWAAAFAESLLDDVNLLKQSYDLINQSPLGSAAAYGVNLPIDRQLVADVLGFSQVQNNVLYVSNSRGKYESIVIHAITQVMTDLSKIAADLMIFSCPEFGYVEIPAELCTGSSLMPQKKNPCGLELVRAKTATVISYLLQTIEIIRGLPSGYNRDFQETKRPLIHSFHTVHEALVVMRLTIDKLVVNEKVCRDAMTRDLFATDYALQLVQEGVPFRDAYRTVAAHGDTIPFPDPVENIMAKKHRGATGNLGLELSDKKVHEFSNWLHDEQERIHKVIDKLLG